MSVSKKAFYVAVPYSKNFEINISKVNKGCGVYRLEVFVPVESVPLVLKDGSGQIIRADHSCFVLESTIPITNGILKFEFQEQTNLKPSQSQKQAIVRYLYVQ
ncbi:hypothetical protein THALO_30213 [Tenacibaculum halocynthiae]